MAANWPLNIKTILENLRNPTSYHSWRHNLWAIAQLIPNMFSAQYLSFIPLTVSEIVAGTDYFDVEGTGTSEDPYIITPKTTVFHTMNVYQIEDPEEPAQDTYIRIKASGTDVCFVEITHSTAFTTYHYNVNVWNGQGYIRPRIRTPSNSIVRSSWDMSGTLFFISFDVNSTDVYFSSDLE